MPSTENPASCVPCEGGIKPLSGDEAAQWLKKTPKWDFNPTGKAITRRYKFKNFKQSLAFVNGVGELAEKEGHHPDITFGWGYADLLLTTHSIGGLHQNDFIMANKINALEE
jgi:4a-hydroxytetrahydrobiopterin dehydratase